MNEVWYGVVNAEGRRVQVSADLHVISRHQTNGSFVFIFKHLPLQRRTQQQHEVIYIRQTQEQSREETNLRVSMEEANGIYAFLHFFGVPSPTNTVIHGGLLLRCHQFHIYPPPKPHVNK